MSKETFQKWAREQGEKRRKEMETFLRNQLDEVLSGRLEKELREKIGRASSWKEAEFRRAIRDGLEDVCPSTIPDDVLEALRITDKSKHFNVYADYGNVGLKLVVYQNSMEWKVSDPWADETHEELMAEKRAAKSPS